jgi:hypothetical protein
MPTATDKTLMFLDAVADWAFARHVEIRIWRTEAPNASDEGRPIKDWRVTVTLRDSEGLFQGTIVASHPARGECVETFAKNIHQALDRCCAEARRKRIAAYAGADPCGRPRHPHPDAT